jgi:hypothetical protein
MQPVLNYRLIYGNYSIIIVVISLILYALLSVIKVSSIKIMFLGIALIVFSNSVLKGMVKYCIKDIILIIGLSFSIAGF